MLHTLWEFYKVEMVSTVEGMGLVKFFGLAAKGSTQITKHAAQRMAERGITNKMVETAISKGTKYFDPKNGTYNYVLKMDLLQGKIC